MEFVAPFLEATVRAATPLVFAALGETITERSGVINIGLEGSIISGALAAFVVAGLTNVWMGFAGAAVAGLLVGLLFAYFSVILNANQIITGTAISMLALGATGSIYRAGYGTTLTGLTIPTMKPFSVPVLSELPFIGNALFAQPPITYLVYVLIPLVWWWMYRTHGGLALRATGENPSAAEAAGKSPKRIRFWAATVGSMLGGVAGGVLVLAQAGTFAEHMSAGRGFIAIAIVVLGRWHPLGAVVAALVFGGASALQYLFQAMGWDVPYQVFLALPYLMTLLALVVVRGQNRAPAALGV